MNNRRDISKDITTASGAPIDIIPLAEMCLRLGKDRSTIWRWWHSGKFPRPWTINGRTIGWFRHQYEAWLQAQQ